MPLTRSLSFVEVAFDLEPTMALQRLGRFDPTASSSPETFTKVHCVGDDALVRHRLRRRGPQLDIEVDGESEGDLLAPWASQLPPRDGLDAFAPKHAVLRRLAAAFPGLRILRVPWAFDMAASAILQQRVSFDEAATGYRRIALRWGLKKELGTAFPSARRLARVPVFELQALGVDAKRARALHLLAREEASRSFLAASDHGTLRKRLLALPGIGPWTTEMILGFAAGDTDALPPGDTHLPALVCRALAGERGGTDERMMELLAPYRGHRFRVIRLLWCAVFQAPHLLRVY